MSIEATGAQDRLDVVGGRRAEANVVDDALFLEFVDNVEHGAVVLVVGPSVVHPWAVGLVHHQDVEVVTLEPGKAFFDRAPEAIRVVGQEGIEAAADFGREVKGCIDAFERTAEHLLAVEIGRLSQASVQLEAPAQFHAFR